MTTEDQAFKKWCPFTRTVSVDAAGEEGAAVNRNVNQILIEGCECMGEVCMAWRWTDVKDDDGERFGYCGLAGQSNG